MGNDKPAKASLQEAHAPPTDALQTVVAEMRETADMYPDSPFASTVHRWAKTLAASAQVREDEPCWRAHFVDVSAMRYMDNGLMHDIARAAAEQDARLIEKFGPAKAETTP